MKEFETLTGIKLSEVPKLLAEPLPGWAYRPIPARGRTLTDINPAFLTRRFNEVFGIIGVGWAFSVRRLDTSADGGDISAYAEVEIEFAYRDHEGTVKWSRPIFGSGSSRNGTTGYATKGAVTAALSAAASRLQWQWAVYAGAPDAPHPQGGGRTGETRTARPAQRPQQPQQNEQRQNGEQKKGFVVPFAPRKHPEWKGMPLQELAGIANGGDPDEAAAAASLLDWLAKKARNADLRAEAAWLLHQLQGGNEK